MFTAKVITVSDRCAAGEAEDKSGPVVADMLRAAGYTLLESALTSDEPDEIEAALLRAVEEDAALIVTTGGTGFSPRDNTPEVTLRVCERPVPGIPEAMRYASLAITPRAMLSRAAAGIRNRSLIVNLPGSPKAAKENLEAVLPALDHGLLMLRGGRQDCAKN
ncbi:MAG: MogA/MoaB family molybdenum cofactor biosynthesis protein [Clostridia bacterium]|nr:MogA/MoaB family molybdenum cofactor biosynthesis protein [Clostridia bacterium]MBQ9189895.1 MogA/MoaB family molybdenum cofactor biosynthesis protein [Clostridia bacterium]MBR3271820.1 MogA/MoaB family molybdenum cofactor biosynthesis protein [Clostridia bacterium]